MTFKAKIHGIVSISQEGQSPVDTTITFTGYRIKLTDEQIGRLYLDPMLVQEVVHNAEYDFDKLRNKEDKKQFSIILKHRLNNLDKGIHHLEISKWNKIKANITHHRYWLYREREWFIKTLVAAAIGFLFALIAGTIGYRQGHADGLKEGKTQSQSSTHQ